MHGHFLFWVIYSNNRLFLYSDDMYTESSTMAYIGNVGATLKTYKVMWVVTTWILQEKIEDIVLIAWEYFCNKQHKYCRKYLKPNSISWWDLKIHM